MPLTSEEMLANGLSDIRALLISSSAQEYICVAFFTLYIYYVLTTIDDEVLFMFPQKWNMGRVLFTLIRYGNVLSIALDIPKSFRSYFDIRPMECKMLFIMWTGFQYVPVRIACDVAIALCLGALLQVRIWALICLVFLLSAWDTFMAVLALGSIIKNYPGHLSPPTTFYMTPELNVTFYIGSPCGLISMLDSQGPVAPSLRDYTYNYAAYGPLQDRELASMNSDFQSYFNFGVTAATTVVALLTFILRYRKHKGGITLVLRRDGGFYLLVALVTRLTNTIGNFLWIVRRHRRRKCSFALNPSQTLSVPDIESSDLAILILLKVMRMFQYVIIPILVQRLIINMRKVDFMGSRPLASTLLFAPASPSGSDPLHVEDEGIGHKISQLSEGGVNGGPTITSERQDASSSA